MLFSTLLRKSRDFFLTRSQSQSQQVRKKLKYEKFTKRSYIKLHNSWHFTDAEAEFAIILMYTSSLEFKMNIRKMKVHIYLRLDNSNPLSPPAFQTTYTKNI